MSVLRVHGWHLLLPQDKRTHTCIQEILRYITSSGETKITLVVYFIEQLFPEAFTENIPFPFLRDAQTRTHRG